MPTTRPSSPSSLVRVVIETGAKRVFASALDWPGWSRSGRDEVAALEALAAYGARYRPVARAAGVRFPARPVFEVVERVPGGATTDFGAPGAAADAEALPPTAAEARRLSALVRAAWDDLDAVVAAAPETLRKGPRGGGRDRDKMVEHVLGAEHGYGRQLGVRLPAPSADDRGAIEATRAAIDAIGAAAGADAPETAWSARYAARRIAWHVLDHAWEIEDRAEP